MVEKPKPWQPPCGGLSFRFSRSWADVEDDDQDGALVSYAASSGESSAEEAAEAQRLKENLLRERDSKRTRKGGNAPMVGNKSLAKGATKRRGGRPAKIFQCQRLQTKRLQSQMGPWMVLMLVVRWRWAPQMRFYLGKVLLDR